MQTAPIDYFPTTTLWQGVTVKGSYQPDQAEIKARADELRVIREGEKLGSERGWMRITTR